jgi:monoamine oxidase
MYDTLVIGAGAAGLAAARDLSAAGKRICVVEARERIGGRMHTLHVPGLPLPIELGAEFIHGDAAPTFAIADAAGLLVHRLPDDHWWSNNGTLASLGDFWTRVARVRSGIRRLRHDVSFAEFLRSQHLSPRLRQLALAFAEGYNAAHADRISAMALLASDDETDERPPQHRIANGYDTLLEWLRAGLDPERTEVRLNTTVSAVTWRKGHVVAQTNSGELAARAGVITIPIGVWKAPEEQPGAIRFTPALPGKRAALAKLEVGHVVKIVFQFRERFWEDANFVHTSDRWMPTWWTTAPVRSTLLTGWAGGHAADALLAEGAEAVRHRALDSMARAYGMKRRDLDALLAASWMHDWQGDPFSRGAYSYAAVGGSGANEALARPVEHTLFFAGEATSAHETGTVSGAIASGRRAARQLLHAR